ncbi:PP2C family serine/threonine-protein phosphatase [Nocardia donostiensis]|uniref:Integrase n=1 Tax=Nocardia donostiensis TaxID=1538463 RepID=A0A1W0B6K9_9NOCA|nr:PP2C family serine/threonine-protein phosphatase [Nocardia donostiensis]ONM46507.1 hypothetical protein B0T46_22800 [Nocardia donostiensis]OQS18150.1 hypothetical protein B0T44_21330 [Nocardia donostiensis]
MEIAAAQVPAESDEDRVITTENAVVLLDGASAYEPGTQPAGDYVDVLGNQLSTRLTDGADLPVVLAEAIQATAIRLGLEPGKSPSSTVVIVWFNKQLLEILVLGDSAVIIRFADGSEEVIVDDRLAQLGIPEADRYRQRLSAGAGFDHQHHQLLQALQRRERQHRNQPGGYWIAEAEPSAAAHAITRRYPLRFVSWVIAATDGAFEVLTALGIPWQRIADCSAEELRALLAFCTDWEANSDPDGQALPRSKRHDDKTIVVVRPRHEPVT